jgi:histidinol-phosphate phosphatase family protein
LTITGPLFLDRDGVINEEKEDDYIRNVSEFRFIDQALNAFPVFTKLFRNIFIVTNQKGVGKGLMAESDLNNIHEYMVDEIRKHGGDVSRIYYSTSVDENDLSRKPNPGMALQARKDYPETDFSRSLMIGNTLSDMKFGKAVGMYTIFIPSAKPALSTTDPLIDEVFTDLFAVAKALQKPDTETVNFLQFC